MPGMEQLGRALLILGGLLVLVGLLLMLWNNIPLLGKLPGDVHVERGRFSFHFPLATCFFLSVILTVVLNIVLRLFRK